MAVLDNEGLLYVWNKIKNIFATKEALASEIKALQDSMGELGYGDMMKATYDKDNDGIVDNAQKVNGHTVESDVPANAKFTDTTYTHPSHTGYSNGLYKITTNGLGHVISATAVKKADITGLGIPEQDTTYTEATSTQDGLMSSEHCVKLNQLPTGSSIASTYAKKTDLDNYLTTEEASTTYVTDDYLGSNYSTSEEVASTYATKSSLDAYAKKTDLANVYVYKGSVASESALPTSGMQVGWVYDISSASSYGGAGMNVAWNGTSWDALGEVFRVASITNSEIDTICV